MGILGRASCLNLKCVIRRFSWSQFQLAPLDCCFFFWQWLLGSSYKFHCSHHTICISWFICRFFCLPVDRCNFLNHWIIFQKLPILPQLKQMASNFWSISCSEPGLTTLVAHNWGLGTILYSFPSYFPPNGVSILTFIFFLDLVF